MNNSASSASCKRKRDDEDESNGENKPVNDKQSNPCVQSQSNKCSVREGHSWWTCMMLDNMPMSMTIKTSKSGSEFLPEIVLQLLL